MKGVIHGRFFQVFGLFFFFLTACTHWSRSVRTSIESLAKAQVVAVHSFETYQTAKQIEFRSRAEKAKTLDEIGKVERDFSDWRKKRDEVITAMNALYASMKVAEATIPLVEQGLRKSAEVDSYVSAGLTALSRIKELLSALGVPLTFEKGEAK